jgi:hypothetical protein
VIDIKSGQDRLITQQDGSIVPFGWSVNDSQIAIVIERGTEVDMAWVPLTAHRCALS